MKTVTKMYMCMHACTHRHTIQSVVCRCVHKRPIKINSAMTLYHTTITTSLQRLHTVTTVAHTNTHRHRLIWSHAHKCTHTHTKHSPRHGNTLFNVLSVSVNDVRSLRLSHTAVVTEPTLHRILSDIDTL